MRTLLLPEVACTFSLGYMSEADPKMSIWEFLKRNGELHTNNNNNNNITDHIFL